MSKTTMHSLSVVILLFALTAANRLPLNPMRAAKCVIPNGMEHISRTVFLQQCVSKSYAQGNETQCYPELGCFPMDAPWTSLLRPFPSPLHPSEINVTLQCYTRANPSKMYNIQLWPEMSLNGCPFNGRKKTVFVTHGFLNSGNFSWLHELKDRYLQQVDANIFVVDWGQGAQILSYLQASSNTRVVGAEVARYIKFLQDKHRLRAANLHLIGHSLGAQISSYVAKRIRGVDRLTALDPAQPGFEGTDKQVRLDKTDAKFIEVVHTNAAPFIPTLGFGMIAPHGHVDFYINGGLHQPGCEKLATQPEIKDIKDLANYPVEVVSQWVCCSHCRAYEIYMRVLQNDCIIWGRKATFAESMMNAGSLGVTEKLFTKANKCTSEMCIPLSLNTPSFKARGVFAATTHVNAPFCETNPEVNRKLLDEIADNTEETKDVPRAGLEVVLNKTKDIASKITGTLGLGKKEL